MNTCEKCGKVGFVVDHGSYWYCLDCRFARYPAPPSEVGGSPREVERTVIYWMLVSAYAGFSLSALIGHAGTSLYWMILTLVGFAIVAVGGLFRR